MAGNGEAAAVPVGLFHTWWRGDSLPELPGLPGLTIEQRGEAELIAGITGIAVSEVGDRLRHGNHFWLAGIEDRPSGWGWCATERFSVGELGITRALPPGNRYLWDFVTVPAARGRGIYGRLLQAIVARDLGGGRFWLGHDMANEASARGIARAGFHEVGTLYREPDSAFTLIPSGPIERADAAAAIFGVAVSGMDP